MRNLKLIILVSFLFIGGPLVSVGAEVELGQIVWAYHEESKAYYPGIPVERVDTIKGGGFKIVFFDTDVFIVPNSQIRPFNLRIGTPVYGKWTDGKYYPGKVSKTLGQAVFVKFDDGDEIWTSYAGLAQKID